MRTIYVEKITNNIQYTIDQELAGAAACIRAAGAFHFHSLSGSTTLSSVKWRHNRHFEIMTLLHQLMRIYSRNDPVKFHPDLIWNDGALGLFGEGAPNNDKKKNNKLSGVRDQFLI